jgi:hypothetical protein
MIEMGMKKSRLLTKAEQKEVDKINKAMKKLVERGITFHCMDNEILLLRGDNEIPEYGPEGTPQETMPNQDAIIARLDVSCQAGGW